MEKRIKAGFFAAMMFMLTFFSVVRDVIPLQAAEDLTLKLHYHRADGNYTDWDVWLWEEGGDGGAYAFEDENGEMVATKVVTPGTTSVGFIVRTSDWTKDIDADQFIDIAEMVSGTVHIYVESGVEGYTKEYGEDAVTGTKLVKARYDGETAIEVSMTGEIKGDLAVAFQVKGAAGEIDVTGVTGKEKNAYRVTLKEPLENTKSYTIIYEGNEYKIVMPNIYSTEKFEKEYTYTGKDLGAVWTKEKTTFKVWAPTAEMVKVNLYQEGTPDVNDLTEQLKMQPGENGVWTVERTGDLNGVYYTYEVTVAEETVEACDPYARTTGVNGQRAMVLDLSSTNPEGWEEDADPNAGAAVTDAFIYELHVRDLSMDESSGIQNAGKFLGLTETGTKTPGGVATGLDHMKELGITHLHLLPFYDYGSVDETKLDKPQFNWGYDPVNYNVPEGSYSTDPYHGEVRVKELKQTVQALHRNGISVVMDVVYNHVHNAGEFCFNRIVPGYFSRIDEDGKYSNGSGCGNDTASERSMVKKYIVDSVCYWADEYHIDGFRFDLVGLLDTETINEIVTEVHKNHPNVIFYGEGWTLDTEVTKEGYLLATQTNSRETPGFAYFSDNIRDVIKGHVFYTDERGYVTGATGLEEEVEKCFMGLPEWCESPTQTVNYVSCHDNLTLMDRIARGTPAAKREERIKMNNLAAAIYMTSQGIPFLQAGEEMLRTKVDSNGGFVENSYDSPDKVNSIKWATLEEEEYARVFEYYKGLIAFRKAHGALRFTDAKEVREHVAAVDGLEPNVTAFAIQGGANGETAEELFVIFNPNTEETWVQLPEGTWNVCINEEQAGTDPIETITTGTAKVSPISAMVLVKGEGEAAETAKPEKNNFRTVGIVAAVAAVGAVIVGIFHKRKK